MIGGARHPTLTQQLRARCEAAHVKWSDSLYFERQDACLTLTREGSLKRATAPSEASMPEGSTLGTFLATQLLDGRVDTQRTRVLSALRSALERLQRREFAVRGDLHKMDKVIDESLRAQMFVAVAAGVPRGTTQLTTHDWETGDPVTFAVQPDTTPQDALEQIFRRAKRMKKGRKLAEERMLSTTLTINTLTECASAVAAAETSEAIDAIVSDARRAAPRDFRLGDVQRHKKASQAKALPCRLFQSARGKPLWVGRNAICNDAILQLAEPNDAWLHAKGSTGSHVIVPLERGQQCPPDTLIEAAHLAAHFSDARDEGVVDVQHTTKRYLRKPKGAPAGLVVVTQEKVLALRIEPLRLKALLDTERATEALLAPPRH